MTFKEELNKIADDHNRDIFDEIVLRLRNKLLDMAAQGYYTYRIELDEKYVPRMIDKLLKWEVIHKILLSYTLHGVTMYVMQLYWNHHEETDKPIGFA